MPREYEDISKLAKFLNKKLTGVWAGRNFARLADGKLYLPTHEEVEAFLAANPIVAQDDQGEALDCDDFSFILKGRTSEYGKRVLHLDYSMCLGIAWGYFS